MPLLSLLAVIALHSCAVVWLASITTSPHSAFTVSAAAAAGRETAPHGLRANLYFGTRTQTADDDAVMTALGWSLSSLNGMRPLRYDASDKDDLRKWGWTRFATDDFGLQRFMDGGVNIAMEYLVAGGGHDGWSLRVNASSSTKDTQFASLFLVASGREASATVPEEMRSSGSSSKGLRGDTLSVQFGNDVMEFDFEEEDLASSESRGVEEEDDRQTCATEHSMMIRRRVLPPEVFRTHFFSYVTRARDAWKVRFVIEGELSRSEAKRSSSKMTTSDAAASRSLSSSSSSSGTRTPSLPPYVYIPLLSNRVVNELEEGNEDDGDDRVDSSPHRVVILQRVVRLPFSMEVINVRRQRNGSSRHQSSPRETKKDRKRRFDESLAAFDELFAEKFLSSSRNDVRDDNDSVAIEMRKHALANMLGSQTYFWGSNVVMDPDDSSRLLQSSPGGLLTGVPSRAFFPRGFLWDEGFHLMLVARWDPGRALEVLSSWLARFDAEGWVAREQILGGEALSRVPPQFVPQNYAYGNPPTLLLAVEALMKQAEKRFPLPPSRWRSIYDVLKRNHDWFTRTQRSGIDGGLYAWKGRSSDGRHTLTSGIDDYPRCHVDARGKFRENEAHVDLLAWIAWYEGGLARLGKLGGVDAGEIAKLEEQKRAHVSSLYKHHWNARARFFNDLGVTETGAREGGSLARGFCEHVGYVGLLPFALELIPGGDSDAIEGVLDALESVEVLNAPSGVRSLAKSDRYYGKDEDYWRGNVWVNVNFLVWRALRRYGAVVPEVSPALRSRCARAASSLRGRLVENVEKQYREKGFLFENYHGDTGEGRGTKPFTGWTALVLLMGEEEEV